MEGQLKILQVLNTGKSNDQHGLVFKVKWSNSNEIAFIQFDIAKNKYPLLVLEYLIARIKQKPVNQPQKRPGNEKTLPVPDQKQIKKERMINSPIQIIKQQQVQNNQNPVKGFFSKCFICNEKNISRMLDYDAIISVDSALAYPVFFKLKGKRVKQKQSKLVKNAN